MPKSKIIKELANGTVDTLVALKRTKVLLSEFENEALNNRLNEMRESSIYNMHLYIDVLKKDFDINIPQEYLDELFNSKGRIGRPQLAIILIKMNLVLSVAEAFNRYLLYAYEKNKKVNQTLSEEECLDLINRAGGIAILAHPNSLLLDDVEIEEEIKRLCSMGLKGLETTHSDLNLKERELYHHLALKYNLLESGGTDYHGLEIKPDILLGSGRNNNVSIKENTLTLTKKIKSRYM